LNKFPRPDQKLTIFDTFYDAAGYLLYYHLDHEGHLININNTYRLIFPYLFMPEGYRTSKIQHLFSLFLFPY